MKEKISKDILKVYINDEKDATLSYEYIKHNRDDVIKDITTINLTLGALKLKHVIQSFRIDYSIQVY